MDGILQIVSCGCAELEDYLKAFRDGSLFVLAAVRQDHHYISCQAVVPLSGGEIEVILEDGTSAVVSPEQLRFYSEARTLIEDQRSHD